MFGKKINNAVLLYVAEGHGNVLCYALEQCVRFHRPHCVRNEYVQLSWWMALSAANRQPNLQEKITPSPENLPYFNLPRDPGGEGKFEMRRNHRPGGPWPKPASRPILPSMILHTSHCETTIMLKSMVFSSSRHSIGKCSKRIHFPCIHSGPCWHPTKAP